MRRLGLLLTVLAIGGSSPVVLAAPPAEHPDVIVCRGTSGEGFSYEWGGECWCANGCVADLTNCAPGVCTPDAGSTGCPDCSHTGTYGADCSGFVSKAWQVPDPYDVAACDVARYTADHFTSEHTYWNVVSMGSLQPADAAAKSTHVILIIDYEDPFGEHEVVEAMGCNYGIVRHSRTFSSDYSGARRINLTSCVCTNGETETESCGDCGSRQRTCENDCLWSPWSPCEGPDPVGEDAICAPDDGQGVCATGRQLCVAGWMTCQPTSASAEICDGLDNNCDGVVDNGTPASLGEGYPCTGTCGTGSSQCVDGQLQCVTPGGDTCDATDPEPEPDPDTDPGMGIGGCNCRASSAPAGIPLLGLLALLLLLGRRRRRR